MSVLNLNENYVLDLTKIHSHEKSDIEKEIGNTVKMINFIDSLGFYDNNGKFISLSEFDWLDWTFYFVEEEDGQFSVYFTV